MKRIEMSVAFVWLLFVTSTLCRAAPQDSPHPSKQSLGIRPICGVPGYTLQTSYRFGKSVKPLPGETAVTSTDDMVKLGWKHDEPWGRINNQLQYYADFSKPETWLGPNHVYEAEHSLIRRS
jgi:hypothetical protein